MVTFWFSLRHIQHLRSKNSSGYQDKLKMLNVIMYNWNGWSSFLLSSSVGIDLLIYGIVVYALRLFLYLKARLFANVVKWLHGFTVFVGIPIRKIRELLSCLCKHEMQYMLIYNGNIDPACNAVAIYTSGESGDVLRWEIISWDLRTQETQA